MSKAASEHVTRRLPSGAAMLQISDGLTSYRSAVMKREAGNLTREAETQADRRHQANL